MIAPKPFDCAHYAAAHSARYVDSPAHGTSGPRRAAPPLPLVWPVRAMPAAATAPAFIDGKLGFYAMDAGAPINAGTWDAVSASANSALTGADLLSSGARARRSRSRPPGHHAGREYMGGYCYLNNAAIAAQHCVAQGAARVAVLDVDFHHGNGTQDIFYDRADVLFASIHGEPRVSYPYSPATRTSGIGAGEGFNLNLPLPKARQWDTYSAALDHLATAIAAHAPDALVVSLGVDTFEHDPISHFRLRSPDYRASARRSRAWTCRRCS